MKQTRREFVGTAVAAAALAGTKVSAARADTGPVRLSLAEFFKDDSRVASLRKGVAAMKALPASDHRSWFWWAATHAYNGALYADALKRDPALARVDRARYFNQCPHFGQSSADFLIWHRAYVCHFERCLRVMAEDETLAIPYWDYFSDAQSRSFPEIFAYRWLDRERSAQNPLFHPSRDLGFTSGRFELSANVCEAHNAMTARNFFSAPGEAGFGGDILDSAHTQLGLIEQRPHNDIHIAVGGVVGDVNGAMADIPTSAFDPVFWVHHANIDRMWVMWAAMPGKGWGPLPPESWFDEQPWVFKDVEGRDVVESRRFYMDRANLGVRYDSDGPNARPLSLPPRTMAGAGAPGGAPPVRAIPRLVGAAAPAPTPDMGMPGDMMSTLRSQQSLFADVAPMVVSPEKPARRTLAAAAPAQAAGGARPGTLAVPHAAPGARVLLELSDISFTRVPSSGFAVYLDPEGATPDNARDYVGLIDLFGATHHDTLGMGGMKAVQRFDVTKLVSAPGGAFTLRVEPYSLLVSRSGTPAPSRPDAVKIGRVTFVVVT